MLFAPTPSNVSQALNCETSCFSYIYQVINETYYVCCNLQDDRLRLVCSRSSCTFVLACDGLFNLQCGPEEKIILMESETMANEKGCQFRLPSNIQIESIIPIWSPFLSKKSTQNNIYSRYFF